MRTAYTIILLFAATIAAHASTLAQQADSAYNGQDFPQAIALYTQALQQDGVSPELYYNLGNAYYRVGDLGHAVINYERALKLNPSMPDARANLEFVNQQILDKPEDDSTFLGNLHTAIMSSVHPNVWALISFSLFLVLLISVGLYVFSNKIAVRKTGFFGGAIVLIVLIYTLIMAHQSSSAYYSHDQAVVIVPTANMSTSPGATAKEDKIIPIHEGTVVEIVDSLEIPGDYPAPVWYDVKINNSTRAWVQASDVERI